MAASVHDVVVMARVQGRRRQAGRFVAPDPCKAAAAPALPAKPKNWALALELGRPVRRSPPDGREP